MPTTGGAFDWGQGTGGARMKTMLVTLLWGAVLTVNAQEIAGTNLAVNGGLHMDA